MDPLPRGAKPATREPTPLSGLIPLSSFPYLLFRTGFFSRTAATSSPGKLFRRSGDGSQCGPNCASYTHEEALVIRGGFTGAACFFHFSLQSEDSHTRWDPNSSDDSRTAATRDHRTYRSPHFFGERRKLRFLNDHISELIRKLQLSLHEMNARLLQLRL
jgi:hypothetical protein